jgi:hypothetical protein
MPSARRKLERTTRREADEPALGVEHVEQRCEVLLAGRAPVHEHERSLGLAGGGADVGGKLAHR